MRRTWNSDAQKHKNLDLMIQEYPGDEDIVKHFNNVLPAFKDKRYIAVDGKPIFLIYDPEALPDAKHFIDVWKKLAKQNGLAGIHFVGLQNAAVSRYQRIFDLGFDALAPSNLWHAEELCKGRWCKLLQHKIRQLFPGRRAVIYTGSTPTLFEEHIKKALEVILQKQDQHKILFLRSWNEWAEGNYVEPDLKFGHGYLDVLKSSILMK